jgi:PAS domain S-box-containing protein
MHAGVYSTDTHGRALLANHAALRMLGLRLEQLVGARVHELVHHQRGDGTPLPAEDCPLLAVIRTGRPARSDDDVFWRADGTALPVTWMSAPVLEDGLVTGAVVVFTDATARHVEAERLAAEHQETVRARERLSAANARLALLARLTEALATLDPDEATGRLARLTASAATGAEWVVVDLVDGADPALVRRAAVTHADAVDAGGQDPGKYEGALTPLGATSAGPLARALLAGTQVTRRFTAPPTDTPSATGDSFDAEQDRFLAALGAAHVLVTPLVIKRQVLGALTWIRTDPAEPFAEADEFLAAEIGRRAAMALDNARVHDQQRSAAEALQRSLLTVLPQPDHLEIVGRYLPATQGVEIGGDWYDAFQLVDGATSIVIGDILGHDLAAAAHMAQVRNLLRGIAADRLEPPSDVLARLDSALGVLAVGALATCLLARIERPPGLDGEGLRQLRWTSAGHLPPAVVSRSGRVRLLETDSDLMLGVDPALPRADHVEPIQPGDTIWLFTDGLVERNDQPLDTGLARLRRALAAVHHLPASRACDELLARMLPDGHPDDVAVLAVRAHPEDRPAPPIASR